MIALGIIDKSTPPIKYRLKIIDAYMKTDSQIQRGIFSYFSTKAFNEGIRQNNVLNHVEYVAKTKRHALIVPRTEQVKFEQELFKDQYKIVLLKHVRERADNIGFSKLLYDYNYGNRGEKANYATSIKSIPEDKMIRMTEQPGFAAQFTGLEMLEAMRYLLINTEYGLSDIIAINLWTCMIWRFIGY